MGDGRQGRAREEQRCKYEDASVGQLGANDKSSLSHNHRTQVFSVAAAAVQGEGVVWQKGVTSAVKSKVLQSLGEDWKAVQRD